MTAWEDLLADVEGQAQAHEVAERATEVDADVRTQVARTLLLERLAAARGQALRAELLGVGALTLRLLDVGADWVLAGEDASPRRHLLSARALVAVHGLDVRASAVPESPVQRRLDLGWALRRIARDRAGVRLRGVNGGAWGGVIAAVGRDHLDLVEEPARPAVTIALDAVAVVTRA